MLFFQDARGRLAGGPWLSRPISGLSRQTHAAVALSVVGTIVAPATPATALIIALIVIHAIIGTLARRGNAAGGSSGAIITTAALIMLGTIIRAIAGMIGSIVATTTASAAIVMIGTVIRAATRKNLLICGTGCGCLADDEAASDRGAGWHGAGNGGKKGGGSKKLGDGHGRLHWVARHSADALEN